MVAFPNSFASFAWVWICACAHYVAWIELEATHPADWPQWSPVRFRILAPAPPFPAGSLSACCCPGKSTEPTPAERRQQDLLQRLVIVAAVAFISGNVVFIQCFQRHSLLATSLLRMSLWTHEWGCPALRNGRCLYQCGCWCPEPKIALCPVAHVFVWCAPVLWGEDGPKLKQGRNNTQEVWISCEHTMPPH